MEKFFSIGDAARECGMTTETLRHYDRIGLVSPEIKDKFTKYRYYSADDLVKLKTIKMLKVMSIPLDEIKRLLSMDDLQKVTDTFSHFEKEAQEKIQRLNEGLEYMRRVKGIYEDLVSISEKHDDGYIYKQYFPERKMLIAPPEERLCAVNLWRYHDLFYSFLGEQANFLHSRIKLFCLKQTGNNSLLNV